MIVDDDGRNVFALTSVLEAHGAEVRYADNGRDAIAQLEADPDVDIIVMDVMMPEMDGYETTRRIRETMDMRSLPIIALTANAMEGDREKCLAAGASDYLSKPVSPEELVARVRRWVVNAEAGQKNGG